MRLFQKNKPNHEEMDGEMLVREAMEQMDPPRGAPRRPRTPLTHRTGAKVTAFFLVIVLAVLAVGCAFGAALMIEAEIYTTPQDILRKDIFSSLTEDTAATILGYLTHGSEQDALNLCRYKNIARLTVHSEGECALDWRYTASDLGGKTTEYTSTWYWSQNDFYYPRDYDLITPTDEITISVSLPDVMPRADEYRLVSHALSAVYALRYWIYVIAAASLAGSIGCFVFLLCASGRRKGCAEPRPGWGTWVPLDVLCAVVVLIAGMIFALFDEADYFYSWVKRLVTYFGGGCALFVILIGWSMSVALRFKLGKWWQNTLLYRTFALCTKILRGIVFWGVSLLKHLPLVWKTGAVCVAVAVAEAVFSLCSWGEYDILLVWLFVKNCIWIPVMLFLAFMLRKLQRGARALAEGDLDYKIDTQGMFGDFKTGAEDLGRIGEGMTAAVEQRIRSERMKTELITNVSHDLKTPLTSIINYSDLIGKEDPGSEKITEYAAVLHRQSERLKRLVDDLVEASRASTGDIEVELAPCELGMMLAQAAGEYGEKLESCHLQLLLRRPEGEVRILTDGRRLWRVFDNLMGNICKYAQPDTRVYLTLEVVSGRAQISFKNTSREALDLGAEELMERFVRGDRSRNSEGNGLGLSIARSLTQVLGGEFALTVDGDLFKVVLTFPLLEN